MGSSRELSQTAGVKHTPGPWLAKGGGVFAPGGWIIAATGDDETDENDGDTQEANARLIAAALDLLEVARMMLAVDDEWKALSLHDRSRVEAAIAKATGEGQ